MPLHTTIPQTVAAQPRNLEYSRCVTRASLVNTAVLTSNSDDTHMIHGQALQSPSTSSGRAPDITIEENYRAHPGSSSQSTKKRTATNVDNDDESGSFTPPSSREQGSKRQRLQPSASNPKVNSKTKKTKKTNVKPMHDDRPEPRGL